MKQRVIFGVCGGAAILLALFVLPPVILKIAMTFLVCVAVFELIASTKLVRDRVMILITVAYAALYGISLFTGLGAYQHILQTVFILALFARLLQKHETARFTDLSGAAFAGICLTWLFLSLVRIFSMDNGSWLVLLPLVAAWGSDTCALFAGMLFGKHKLAPVVSPKKTVEGAVGGVLGATLLMVLVVLLYNKFTQIDIPIWAAVLLGAVGAVIGQLGDLTFSVIKRHTGIKDYGHIFPGHGGVLDRFDSVVFVAPVVEIILQLVA